MNIKPLNARTEGTGNTQSKEADRVDGEAVARFPFRFRRIDYLDVAIGGMSIIRRRNHYLVNVMSFNGPTERTADNQSRTLKGSRRVFSRIVSRFRLRIRQLVCLDVMVRGMSIVCRRVHYQPQVI